MYSRSLLNIAGMLRLKKIPRDCSNTKEDIYGI